MWSAEGLSPVRAALTKVSSLNNLRGDSEASQVA